MSEARTGARGPADWLGLAATPAFALMALVAAMPASDAAGQICGPMMGHSLLSGMAPMYAAMSVFHASPWLRLAAGLRRARNAWQD